MKMLNGKKTTKHNFLAFLLLVAILVASLASCAAQGEKGERGARGERGSDGFDGVTPHIGENQNWWIGTTDTGVPVSGKNGVDGKNGADGLTPKFKFDDTTHILSVSYDDVEWVPIVDLSSAFQGGSGGANGVDGITPQLKIDENTNYWMVSYDKGATWTSLNVLATGEKGNDGTNGNTPMLRINSETLCWEVSYDNGASYTSLDVPAKGADGQSATVRINAETFEWEVSYDGETYTSLGVVAKGTDGSNGENGKDGKTPSLKVENNKLYAFYDGDTEGVLLIDFSEIVQNGSNGSNGTDGRGISSVKIEGNSLVIYYTDDTSEIAGTIGSAGNNEQTATDIYTDALDFYPINGGTEYGVSIGRAIYLTKIVIPDTYNGLPVTTILAYGFCPSDDFNSVLEEVVIPDSITEICESAFEGCRGITHICIPASVEKIGKFAFSDVPQVYVGFTESEKPDGWEMWGADEIVWAK